MIDPQHFERVRIVQDRGIDSESELPPEEDGTKVLADVLDASDDSLFPLQGALGYEIHQTLFVGPNSLIVEGASDLLYIEVASGALRRAGRQGLDERWTITPVGGAAKVPSFVSLLGSQRNMKVATLIDVQKRDLQIIENLHKRKLLEKKHVLTFAAFTRTMEADIEDMFDEDFYLELVNAEFAKSLQKKITSKAFKTQAPRILVRIKNYLESSPLKDGARFSHYRPARYLEEHLGDLALPDGTLNRFEEAFVALNKLL